MGNSLLEYYKKNQCKGVSEVKRSWSHKPTIVSEPINEGCRFNNTLISGLETIIIDNEAIEEILLSFADDKIDTNLLTLLINISNVVNDYFYSNNQGKASRAEVYSSKDGLVLDEEGMIIGTKLSALKGKNVAKCSEKTIAGYLILETLFQKGVITREPSILITELKAGKSKAEPHACLLLNKETEEYPKKHIIFDIENPNKIMNGKEEYRMVGLYTLTDKEYVDLINGGFCVPKPLAEFLAPGQKVLDDARTFGNAERDIER